MSRWTPTETLRAQTLSHDWHLQLHVAVSCLLSEEKDRYRFIIKTWKHPNLRRNDLVLLVLTTTDLFLDTNVPLKKTFGARIKKLAFICFWKTRLCSDLSVSVARCHIQRSRRRRTESVAEFQYLFDVTWYVPACWWRQNQDFIEKPGSFPHSNQVVVVSEQNLSMSTSLWQHTNKNETSGNVMLLQICGLQKLGDIYSCDRVGPPTGEKPPEFIMF